MKTAIRHRALELGFDDCRFTTAEPPRHASEFQQWLAEKKHGEMGYLERNAAKRLKPDRVLPGARAVISLAASYHGADRPIPRSALRAPHAGIVARYARCWDYHKVLGERLT